MRDILKAVLDKCKPDKETQSNTLSVVSIFLKDLNNYIRKANVKAVPVLGGSFGKQTWLKGDYDVDVFVKFDLSYDSEKISDILAQILAPWNPERIHGSRDYFWIKKEPIQFEVVPVLNIRKAEDAKNVTDFSPWHVDWVNKFGLKDDILLAKKFMKGIGVYGAESYIRGFSGHVVDILVIFYKGFLPLLKAAVKWKDKQIIDPSKKLGKNALFDLNQSKITGPLIVVDPVQKQRNAAAAVGPEKFDLFMKSAKLFLKKPVIDFFFSRAPDVKVLSKKGTVVIFRVSAKEGRKDVMGSRLVRIFEFLKGYLSEFSLKSSAWTWDGKSDAMFYFVVKNHQLSLEENRRGPPIKLKDAVDNFKRIHKETFVKGVYVWAKVKRKFAKVEDLEKLSDGPFVKDKGSFSLEKII